MSSIVVNGDTSGSVTLSAPATAGSVVVTLPSTTGTMLTTASTTGISGSAISSGTVPEAYGGTGTSTGYYGFKNRIINGGMVIDQRNAGASVTPTNGQYLVDRFTTALTQASKFTAQQSTTAPTGFTNSLKITSSSTYSVVSTDYFGIGQVIEGFNVADLGWGTANAKTVTLSFQVYSSLTGTFGGAIFNDAANRSYPFTYSISSANTWTTASVTIAGDTTGTWATNNTGGMKIYFSLGTGSTYSGTAGAWAGTFYLSATGATSVVGTNGATLYITGVQLEKGSTATSFDYRPYGTELQLAQRYYERLPTGVYGTVGVRTTDWYGNVMWQVEKRANPTCTLNGTINIVGSVGDINTQTPTGLDNASTKTIRIYRTGGSFTSQAGSFYIPNYLEVSAEL